MHPAVVSSVLAFVVAVGGGGFVWYRRDWTAETATELFAAAFALVGIGTLIAFLGFLHPLAPNLVDDRWSLVAIGVTLGFGCLTLLSWTLRVVDAFVSLVS